MWSSFWGQLYKIRSKIIGVLNVESDAVNAFHREDVTMMYTMADQIAIAIENARLFQEREARIQELLDRIAGKQHV